MCHRRPRSWLGLAPLAFTLGCNELLVLWSFSLIKPAPVAQRNDDNFVAPLQAQLFGLCPRSWLGLALIAP